MKPISVQQLAQVVQGTVLQGPADVAITGVTIDNRTVHKGDLFVAFIGQRTDGHQFIPDAFERGASAALVSSDDFRCDGPNPLIRVENPLAAIQELAKYERQGFFGPVIGITGSNGKTTTKEMLRTVFQTEAPCLFTPANLNNELGLPLTILQRNEDHRAIILEMGMRGMGQIAALCEIAKPTAGLITNIGHSHIELLGSQEAIASAKAELLDALPETGILVLNGDDPWLRKVSNRFSGAPLWFGLGEGNDAYATDIRTDGLGTTFVAHLLGEQQEVFIPTYGFHNVQNALGALLMGRAHRLNFRKMAYALKSLTPSSGRLHFVEGSQNRMVIDDCYNASPASMQASLGVLKEIAHNRSTVAILGDMYELGDFEEEGHQLVGKYVVEQGIDILIAVGPKSEWIAKAAQEGGHPKVIYYPSKKSLLGHLHELPASSVVLVKASRGMQFEEIVQYLSGTKDTETIH